MKLVKPIKKSETSHTFHLLALLLLNLCLLQGCADFDISPELDIVMYGVNSAPDDASGDLTPLYQTYTLEDISLSIEGEQKSVWTAAEHPDQDPFRIIERPQKLAIIPISEYKDLNVTPIQIRFSKNVTGASRTNSSHSFELSEPTFEYGQAFVLEEGRDYSLAVKIYWRNTVSEDTMAVPSFVIEPE